MESNREPVTLLELRDVSTRFGAIKALDGINMTFHEGEIHAVVGEHGAGKSTLAKTVSHLISPDRGAVLYQGKPYSQMSYKETIAAGVRMVFQKMQLNDSLTVAENMFIANKKEFQSRAASFSQKKVTKLTEAFFRENRISLNPKTKVSSLELSDRALLSIVRNLYFPPRVLILDEALEKLSAQGLERIIQILRKLKNNGSLILFITHRIDDLYMIADRVSVVRKGKVIITDDIHELDKISLIKMAYTQFSRLEDEQAQAHEFSQLLKYNEVILKQLPISLIVTNYDNRIRTVNESALSFLGFRDQAQVQNISIEALFSGNPEILELMDEAQANRESCSRYHLPLSLNSSSCTVNIVVFPIFDGGLLIGNMFILEDITERERLRDQLVLSEKLASLGLLAAGVGHEINNPLGVISNYLESFKMNKIAEDEKTAIFDYLFEQINYISQIIGNLVSFSENQTRVSESFNAADEIRKIINLIRFNGREKDISIRFSCDEEEMFPVCMNRNEFKQVLLNLFKNSFEVLSGGGGISVNLFHDEKGTVLLFRDDGPGISFEDPNDVFLPFKSSKKMSSNYGLGLSLCFNILNRSGGDISLLQEEGRRGCCFKLSLPS